MNNLLGIVVNPFSGRDVRRVAARASTSDHHEKQQQVTRLVLAALSQGVEKIFLAHEPFRINEKAVENLPQRDQIELLKFKLTHRADDTHTMMQMMWDQGCRVFIVLGGDGTSRIVARDFPDATILPLSTGTNNVFPYRLEASVAGIAAGLVATQKISSDKCHRCKRIIIEHQDDQDIALIDAVLLRNDSLGNLLPFAAEKLDKVLLTRAEPASIGISPIGGYLLPSGYHDDWGVIVDCDQQASRRIEVPISPGLHADIGIAAAGKLSLGEPVQFIGPGVLAFDGDRTVALESGESATGTILRDGPKVIETEKIMALASVNNLFEYVYKTH